MKKPNVIEPDPLHHACLSIPAYALAYAPLAAAELNYETYRHSKKSDPPRFYDARDRLTNARQAWERWTLAHHNAVIGPVMRRLAAERESLNHAPSAIVERVTRLEALYRVTLDDRELYFERTGHRDPHFSIILAPRHAVLATLLGYLERAGLAVMLEHWEGWAKDRLDELHPTDSEFIELPKGHPSGKSGYIQGFELLPELPTKWMATPLPLTRSQRYQAKKKAERLAVANLDGQ